MKRSIVLVLMALFVLAPLSSAQENQDAVKPEVTAKATDAYTCPMHPDVRSDKAVQCLRCGMDLQKNAAAAGTKACCEGKSAECQKKCAEMKASGAKGSAGGCCAGAAKASPKKTGAKQQRAVCCLSVGSPEGRMHAVDGEMQFGARHACTTRP